jgi:ParB-like chromosome segregation protein Spo0J
MSAQATVEGFKVHPAANLFPLMDGTAFDGLVKSIRENGLRVPVTVFNDLVLDGRNRIRACVAAGVEPRFVQFEGGDPIKHVVALNLDRRHLSESQRAMVAAKLANLPRGANQHAQVCASSQTAAAGMLNVSRRSVQKAREVLDAAVPEVVQAVERGDLAVDAAAKVAGLDAQEQIEVLGQAGGNMRRVAALVRDAQGVALPNKRGRKSDPKVAERDVKILAVYHGAGGESPKETARVVGVPTGQVHQALERAGLNTKAISDRDPLRGMIEQIRSRTFAWDQLLDEEVQPPWDRATEAQRAEAIAALKELRSKASTLINRMSRSVNAARSE